MNSLCRYTASHALAAMRGLFFCHTAPTILCRPPPIAQAAPHLRHPIRGLLFQHINRVVGRPPALRQVLPPARRYCTFPPRPVMHFTYRYSRWYYDPRKVAVAMVPLIGIGGVVIADYGYLETVPYTNRTHFVLHSPLQEREVGESRFACLKERNARVILDAHHPDTIRVNDITSRLVQAVHSSLIIKSYDTVMLHSGKAGSAVEVLKRKLENTRRAAEPATGHLNGLNWEVLVVKDKRVTAWCLPAGKIIVPTGLLKFFKTDAEVATMIAHEIGHIVARHRAEKVVYRKWLPRPLRVPFLRRMEIEADHIGMMLLAAAGFDPRVAPLAYEKLGGDGNRRLLSTHPSNKKRSQCLSKAKIMEEAMELYREALLSPDRSRH